MPKTKTCSRCEQEKVAEDFARSLTTKDKLSHICRACKRLYDQNYRKENREKINAKERKWRKENRDWTREKWREYRENNPKKYRAHYLVCNAVKRKRLEKEPCEVCGSELSQAHHDDYDKPLEVRWLCAQHHSDWHKLHGEGANAA